MTAANGPEGRGPIVPINTGGSSNMGNVLEYDAIASGVFAPLYPVVAETILERTGVVSGKMLNDDVLQGFLKIENEKSFFVLHL